MKLRIRANTIRIRLSEPEVNLLANGKTVVGETHFPSSVLTYKVQPSSKTAVDFIGNVIQVSLQDNFLQEWANSDQVSISHEITGRDDNILSILVEKDFKCLTVRPEDESDLFSNPNKPHC
jgi:uncharacterized protein DUF7009